jgi:tetratricopeptide (TPR) repeat protein
MKLQDLVQQATRELAEAGVPAKRVTRALKSLRTQLPESEDVDGVSVFADGGRVVASDGDSRWEPDSGQVLMDLSAAPPTRAKVIDVTELAARSAENSRRQRAEAAARRHQTGSSVGPDSDLTALQWFEHGCELEGESRADAIQAYHRALELDSGMTDAHVNLGRLYGEARDPARAEAHYRAAILAAPADALPWFNLAVLLEDLKRIPDAVTAYEKAVTLDPDHADAHYNLALLLEALGRKGGALKHLMRARFLYDRPLDP